MKYILSIFVVIMLALTACDKLPKNGELDGQWQLMEMATKTAPDATEYAQVTNKKSERIFWRFQLDLLNIYTQLGNLNGHSGFSVARFKHANGKLDIAPTYIHFENRDSLLTDPSTTALLPMGIRGNAANFTVEELNSERMVLTSPMERLTFRKF